MQTVANRTLSHTTTNERQCRSSKLELFLVRTFLVRTFLVRTKNLNDKIFIDLI